MCGIAGYRGSYRPDVARAMARLIAHRGPDDEGFFFDKAAGLALAHRRLSIIDLSPAGHQPMTDPSGRYTICYNGEVYNYRELRRALDAAGVRFRGNSDTEVILALFARDGVEAFGRLNGIFALAIWDAETRVLTLARDGMGVKPLYLGETASGIAFASEIKALLALPDLDRTLDPVASVSYLTYLWTAGERTMLKSVRKLAPGSWLTIDARGARATGSFYSLPLPNPAEGMSDRDLVLGTEQALRTAVERQMVADVEVGAFLSGGLDSSAIVAFAREHARDRQLQCFTIDAGQDGKGGEIIDDLPYARQAARHLGVDLHEVRVDGFSAEDFEGLIYQLDEPEADPAALNSLHIAGLARRSGIKVLLSGTGGDDLFTGYRRHEAARWDGLWAGMPGPARRALHRAAGLLPARPTASRRVRKLLASVAGDTDERVVRLFEWLPAEQAAQLLAAAPADAAAQARAPLFEALQPLAGQPAVERTLRIDQKFFLTDHNLNYADKTGMAHGVEIRVPFLDPDLVAWAATLPLHAKLRRGRTKWALRKAMEPHLPREIIYRPKSGFGLPLRAWLGTTLRPMLEELLDPRLVSERGLFDPAAVAKLRRDTAAGTVDGSYALLGLMAIELWNRRFVDSVPRAAAA